MKKFLSILFLISMLFAAGVKAADQLTFDEAFEQSSSKPMLVLIYAQWADNYQTCVTNFLGLRNEFGDQFNYVYLNIASSDTKSFNSKYHIYPNVPYVLMFRDKGKVSRYIPRDCVTDNSCMISKIRTFLR